MIDSRVIEYESDLVWMAGKSNKEVGNVQESERSRTRVIPLWDGRSEQVGGGGSAMVMSHDR